MEEVGTLIAGAGVTGLATAAALSERGDNDYVVVERDGEIGGYCKTVKQDGFVWDYSGHFFHFRNPEIERWLRDRMPGQVVRTLEKKSFVYFPDGLVDFPFQKNIHQLPRSDFIDCLHDLYFAHHGDERQPEPTDFKAMLVARFGRSIAEKFLIPYNEKLYATDLGRLDIEAMGRFFPHASMADIVRNMKTPDSASYNATFAYPAGGAIEYVRALASAVRPGGIVCDEALVALDWDAKVATTTRRAFRFRRLVSSLPFVSLLRLLGLAFDEEAFSCNRVLVFNMGFDRKGPRGVHWIYYPQPELSFYRVGFYDNIFETDRMSLYVEIGLPCGAAPDAGIRDRVLADLAKVGIVDGHRVVAEHSVAMDPAYVHITKKSMEEVARVRALLKDCDIYSIGRYGSWTYCSIEDNIVEARRLVDSLSVSP